MSFALANAVITLFIATAGLRGLWTVSPLLAVALTAAYLVLSAVIQTRRERARHQRR